MGYANYWSWETPLADAHKFAAWSKDVQQLIDYLTTPGRDLPGYVHRNHFDYTKKANHLYTICSPDGTGAPIVTPTMVAFNGDASLMEDHEDFVVRLQDLELSNHHGFCKTNLHPYDLLVVTSLVRFAHYFPTVSLWSDGEEHVIMMGLSICQQVFGENNTPLLPEEDPPLPEEGDEPFFEEAEEPFLTEEDKRFLAEHD